MRNKRKVRNCRWLLPVITGVILIVVALVNILPDYLDKAESAKTYEKLRKNYLEESGENDKDKKKDWWLTDVFVNFEELHKQNEDIVAWIRFDNIQDLGIDYPVLYSGDNEKYLRSDLYGEFHIAGSIFLEGLNSPDFSDCYNILYGHNMNDGSMFGNLDQYRDQAFWEKNQYFTLYTEDMVYRYQVFACQEAINGGYVYKIGYEPGEEYQKFIDDLGKDSLIDTGIRPDSSHKVMTLSTCTGNGYGKRFTVHAVCVDAQGVIRKDEKYSHLYELTETIYL